MVQRKLRIFGALLFVFFSCINFAKAVEYNAQSPYRLIFVEQLDPNDKFDPNKDLLNVSTAEKLKEVFTKDVLGSVTKGMLPLSGLLGDSFSEQNTDFLTALTSMSAVFSESLEKVMESHQMTAPFESAVYLIPFQSENRNLFYSASKISMSPDQVSNVLMTSKDSTKFEATVTEQIKALQALRSNTPNPLFLLGIQSTILINNSKCAGVKSCLKVNALVALKPTGPAGIPFTQANDQVTFENIVIPGSSTNLATARLLLTIPLTKTNDAQSKFKAPTLEVEFGEFESYSQGQFKLKESGRQNMAPGMQGKFKNKGFAKLTFSFSSLIFDLENQNVRGLNILTSLGYVSKRGRLPIGGFKVKSVNTQFEDEINKTIDAEIKAVTDSAEQNIESKLQYTPLLKEALQTIFGRLN